MDEEPKAKKNLSRRARMKNSVTRLSKFKPDYSLL